MKNLSRIKAAFKKANKINKDNFTPNWKDPLDSPQCLLHWNSSQPTLFELFFWTSQLILLLFSFKSTEIRIGFRNLTSTCLRQFFSWCSFRQTHFKCNFTNTLWSNRYIREIVKNATIRKFNENHSKLNFSKTFIKTDSNNENNTCVLNDFSH